jgi:hypothetical protein
LGRAKGKAVDTVKKELRKNIPIAGVTPAIPSLIDSGDNEEQDASVQSFDLSEFLNTL